MVVAPFTRREELMLGWFGFFAGSALGAYNIASVEVTSVALDGYRETLYISIGCGAVNDGEVDVTRLCKADAA